MKCGVCGKTGLTWDEATLHEKLCKKYHKEIKKLRGAIEWALGMGDSDFGDNKPENAKPFWWRTELRKRAGL